MGLPDGVKHASRLVGRLYKILRPIDVLMPVSTALKDNRPIFLRNLGSVVSEVPVMSQPTVPEGGPWLIHLLLLLRRQTHKDQNTFAMSAGSDFPSLLLQ